MKQILAWHFVGDTLRNGSPIPKDGKWLKYDGRLELCSSGLHWSRNPFDALQYAPGATLCRVAVRGKIFEQDDKGCSSERMIICRMDATELLRYFARMQAVKCLEQWETEPPDVVLDYLMTGNEDLRAAAWAAARDAARDAARAAAWAAALAAARAAALAAARAAAWDAAWDAALGAARDAARDAAWGAARDAARNAARDAAWDAALGAARKEFTDFVNECFGV